MFSRRDRRRSHREWVLWGVPLGMITIAGVLIASTQRQADYADWYHHWITAAFGVLLALGLERLPLQRLRPLLVPVYALTVISLVAVRVIGTTALGAQRWISIGGVHVQPSEFAKIAAILLVAAVLSRHPVERPVDLMRPLGVIAVPWLLVFIQPGLGTSLVFGALMLTMLYWSGMPIEWVILLLSPLVTALLSGLLPWAMALWIPLMGVLAYRSLPWKRLAAAATLAIHGAMAAAPFEAAGPSAYHARARGASAAPLRLVGPCAYRARRRTGAPPPGGACPLSFPDVRRAAGPHSRVATCGLQRLRLFARAALRGVRGLNAEPSIALHAIAAAAGALARPRF